ncbi:MAG: DUF5071 domain-containing protein [Lachnospiraceae bacterium]|nr:DUF5071 domain-containing protein [Lachnospiraceae bacterium]
MVILICGLNGCGKSTLGKLLADRLSYAFIDNEDLYFPKEDASYEFAKPRSREEVIRLLEERIEENDRFVFAAVRGDYGEKLLQHLEMVIYLEVPREIRYERVRTRSFEKFGARVLPGGDLHQKEQDWFSIVESRPEDYVTKWLANANCPVLRLDGTRRREDNIEKILAEFFGERYTGPVKELLPKDKFDLSSVDILKAMPDERTDELVPELLAWIQDMNWPVAPHMVEVLGKHHKTVEKYLPDLLKPEQKDAEWKRNIIQYLLHEWSSLPSDDRIITELVRIADHPAEEERNELVDTVAGKYLKDLQ